MAQVSVEHSYIPPSKVKTKIAFDARDFDELYKLGINIAPAQVSAMMEGLGEGMAMDALTPIGLPTLTTPSITTPVQFLQNWLPGFVAMLTTARKIDELVGVSTIGSWEDEEVIQGMMELTGSAVPYGDFTNVPFASWNTAFTNRQIVRFEEGMRVGTLEEARTSRMKVNTAELKRKAASEALEINRNAIGFFGYQSSTTMLTYGYLNDPNRPAYVTVAVGSATDPIPSQTTWAGKGFQSITKDIRIAMQTLRTQSGERIDPGSTPITFALPTSVIDYLTVTTDFGMSVQDWLTKSYPNVTVKSAPELVGANGGANVWYVYAESVASDNISTDDGRTWVQIVPTRFKVLGVQNMIKGYEEDYSNATAGVMLKRPYALLCYSGV